jgi:hypothetical protein
MSDGRTGTTDLPAALHALGKHLEVPPAADLAPRVRSALEEPGRARLRPVRRPGPAHLARAAAAAVVLAAALVAVSPTARDAVAGWLGVLGIDIRTDDRPPRRAPATPDTPGLGEPASLAEARRAVAFPVAVPEHPPWNRPDRIHVEAAVPAAGRVTFVYLPRAGLPEAGGTGIGMLITQFRARLDEDVIRKLIASGGSIQPIAVGDDNGYWISGRPHVFYYVDSEGRFREDTLRLASNTLVWEREGTTYRLESALGRERAAAIARSMR